MEQQYSAYFDSSIHLTKNDEITSGFSHYEPEAPPLLDLQLYAEKVATRGLCAIAQAESLRYKLLGGLAVRR